MRKVGKPRFNLSSLSRLESIEEIFLKEEDVYGQEEERFNDHGLVTFLNHFPKLRAITFNECYVRNIITNKKSDLPGPSFQLRKLDVQFCLDAFALDWLTPALSSPQTLHLTCLSMHSSLLNTAFPKFIMAATYPDKRLERCVQKRFGVFNDCCGHTCFMSFLADSHGHRPYIRRAASECSHSMPSFFWQP
ncbi:hypothetical protein GALMADRAFT_229284 [Galerina marginata CBS 339.88]|uniref:Uncharacterized protein n=1 Tax=Galerina marginata (strain CBS 339.88) TaxID=685588 RepID=A0A067SY91_GALM3|nr:hypothetical protein GALMADRAFT_229284 [Galerina marginata CBS 339.88]